MRSVIGLAWFLAMAATTATASADGNRDEVWFGGGSRALRSASANALTADNLAGASLGYGRELGLTVVPDLSVWAVADLAIGAAQGTMFHTLSTEVSALGVTGGLRARYRIHRRIAASARGELGAQRIALGIADHAAQASASDHGWGTMASVGAALDVCALARPRFGFGLRAELGYVMARAIELTPRGEAGGTALRLAMADVPIGSLDLSGPTFVVSLVGQF
jgi:hypothetical protein